MQKKWTSYQGIWTLGLSIWSVLFLLPFFWKKGLGVVSKTFMEGSLRFWQGGNPYSTPEIGDVFHYSPLFAALYGFFAHLPPLLHLIFWALVNSLVFFYAITRWVKLEKKMGVLLWIALAACLMELDISQRYHQANALIIGIILLGIAFYRDEKYILSGLVFALGINFKIIPALFAFPLLWPLNKRYALALFGGLVIYFLLPAVFCGWERNIFLHQEQFNAIFSDLDHRQMLDIKSVLIRHGFPQFAEEIRLTILIFSLLIFCSSRFLLKTNFPWTEWFTFGAACCLLLSPRTESPTFVLLAPSYLLLMKDGTKSEKVLTLLSLFIITVVFTAVWDPFFHLSIQNNYLSKVMGSFLIWLVTGLGLAMKIKHKFTTLIIVTLVAVGLCIAPFALALTSHTVADFFLKQISYKIISENAVVNVETEQQKVDAIFRTVQELVHSPWEYGHEDVYPLHDLIMGMGYCDQQANVFITLLRKQRIKANLVFLYKDDLSPSTHTVAEVLVDGKWQVYDPFTGIHSLREQTGQFLSIEDIHARVRSNRGDGIYDENGKVPDILLEQYRGTPRTFRNNYSHRGTLRETLVRLLLLPSRLNLNKFASLYQDFYFAYLKPPRSDMERFYQAKLYYLFNRHDQAEKIFTQLNETMQNDKHYEIVLLWHAANLLKMNEPAKAEEVLLSMEQTNHRIFATRLYTRYFWGQSLLKQNNLEEASRSLIRFYQRSAQFFASQDLPFSKALEDKQRKIAQDTSLIKDKATLSRYLRKVYREGKTIITKASPLIFSDSVPDKKKTTSTIRGI